MALHDFRKIIEVDAETADGSQPFVGVGLDGGDAARPLRLELALGGIGVALFLDESEAGELLDALTGALRELVGDPQRHAAGSSEALSEPSASL